MSKVLLVLHYVGAHPATRLLRILGIPFEVAYFTDNLQTPRGAIAWNNDSAIRNYLKQYDAVLVGVRGNLLNVTLPIFRSFRWLAWNEPDDPPVAYLGVDPRAGYTEMNPLPSDFPIIRPDASNPSGTLFAFTTAEYGRTAGLRVRLTREHNAELYTNGAIMQATTSWAVNDGYLYRLDMAKHDALGGQGEILALPVSEDIAFPNDAVCAYRYKNRYLLPMCIISAPLSPSPYIAGAFWLLYALKLLGIQPRSSIPAFLCMDDAITLSSNAGVLGQPTRAQFARIGLETYRYIAETFYPRTGGALVLGVLTGGRYGRPSEPITAWQNLHWRLVQNGQYWTGSAYANLEPEAHENIVRWHNLLVQHHRGGLPCTIHDHTIRHRQNRVWTTFTRHSDSGYAYAAPKDVPKARGTLVRKANWVGSPPAEAVERMIDGEVYYEYGMPMTGTGAIVNNLDMRSVHGCRVAWESAVAEMQALGFPDAIGNGSYPLIISPNFLTGGRAVWRVLYEIGYRLVRCFLPVINHTLAPEEFDVEPVPFSGVFEGLHFVASVDWDCGSATGGTYGLWHATQGNFTAVGVHGLDLGGDISSLWATDRPNASRRAYRRYVGMATERFLQGFSTLTALPVCHPPSMLSWADPNDPTRPFDPNDPDSRINFLLEVAWNLEKVVRVLSPYLKWGNVLEYIEARERVVGG